MISPYKGGKFRITSIYGMRTMEGETIFHSGIDCVGISSKEVCAVASGTVVVSRIVSDKSNTTWQWGNYVAVKGDDGKTVYYCHMSERKVTNGQRVEAGDVIGIEGNTGYSFGAHLHLEVRDETTNLNAAEYIAVPNREGTYTAMEESEIMLSELDKTVGEKYNKLEDMPEWARETVKKLTEARILLGDENGALKLSYQMLRMLVILDRAGMFG